MCIRSIVPKLKMLNVSSAQLVSEEGNTVGRSRLSGPKANKFEILLFLSDSLLKN